MKRAPLVASLSVPARTPRYTRMGRPPVCFDVGNGEQWTVQQICKHTGCRFSAVYERIRRGLTGAALIAPAKPYNAAHDVGGGQAMTATEIAAHVGTRLSTVSERMRKGLRGRALLAPVPQRTRNVA